MSSSTPRGPNPFGVLWSVIRSLAVRKPRPRGSRLDSDTAPLDRALQKLRASGIGALADVRNELHDFRDTAQRFDPDEFDRDSALAFWLNLYNAGVLDVAARAAGSSAESVLRVPRGFREPWVVVAGERLSLDNIEHGKIRRFEDPRIHGALVCGSASCPTLRHEPYAAATLDEQLDDQLRSFFAAGGAVVEGEATEQRVLLTRVLLWYGSDFVRPRRMPVFRPAGKGAVTNSVRPWLPAQVVAALDDGATVGFQPYDWSLACSIG